jgi:outer membrane protein
MKYRVALMSVLFLGSSLAAVGAAAEESAWEVRVRAVYLDPANRSDAIPSLAVPKDAIHIDSKTFPEIDFEYFFSPHWSSELILTYPQKQTVTVESSALGGAAVIGSFKHTPPVLTAKYNFNPYGAWRPYIGAGVNFTLISDSRLAVPTAPPMALELSRTSVGPAAQAGFDYRLTTHWFAHADVKWALLRADVKYDSATIARVSIDPLLFAVGMGYRF